MSASVTRGPWEPAGPDEDDAPQQSQDRNHAKTAMQAAVHAGDAADEAREHAVTAKEHAARAADMEKLLMEAVKLGEEMKTMTEANQRAGQAMAALLADVVERMTVAHREGMERMSEAVKAAHAPRRVVRDASGRVSGVETA